jgi:hypothetical protein
MVSFSFWSVLVHCKPLKFNFIFSKTAYHAGHGDMTSYIDLTNINNIYLKCFLMYLIFNEAQGKIIYPSVYLRL